MTRNKLAAALFLSTLATGAIVFVRSATAQAGPLEFIPLAQGYSPDRHIKIDSKGPSDVLQAKLSLQPSSELGWHVHPGPVIFVVTKGTLTEYSENGCVTTYPAGSVLIESPGEVHRVVNPDASVPAEGYATFILPAGNPPLIPVTEPRLRACGVGQDK